MEFASVPLKTNVVWILPTLSVCPSSILTHIESRPNLKLESGNCESYITKNRGACALICAGELLYTITLKSGCRKPDLSLEGLVLVPLSKIGTRLLASLVSKGEKRNSLACLRNAGSYFAGSYCRDLDQNELIAVDREDYGWY